MNHHLLPRLHLRCFLGVNARTMVRCVKTEDKGESKGTKEESNQEEG
jgi:hypothetical protein